jgi:hypothetical protein
MGSNMYFPYEYAVAFNDDYSPDDKSAFNELVASMPADVDSNELEGIIIHTCGMLQEILHLEPGIHHVAQIITYKTYRIKVELNNTSWHIPYTLPFKYNKPVYTNNKIIHYGPETIIRLTQV